MKKFKFKMVDGRHIENRFFGHNSAADCKILWNFAWGSRIAWYWRS